MKLAAASVLVTACIASPAKPGAMCEQTSDCASGEVCQEGVCWGDPPAGSFAATLGPPSNRGDLVGSEIAQLAIPQDGWLGAISLAQPVQLSGRVEAYCSPTASPCDTSSLGATITITRESEFAGGPGFSTVIASADGVARSTNSFSAAVPVTGENDPPFVVTVVPDGRDPAPPSTGVSPATLAPPMRTTIAAMADVSTTFVLGGADSTTIDGTVSDGLHPLPKYRIAALGQWDPTTPLAEVSTVVYTTDGTYHLALASGVTGPFTIVAAPDDPTVVAPTLFLDDVAPGTTQATLTQPTNLGEQLVVTIPITGTASNGAVAPVVGATVTVTGEYQPEFGAARARLTVQATTDDTGNALLTLLGGSALRGLYRVSVVPPAGSNLGVLYDQPLVLDVDATSTDTVPAVRLASRIALSGTITDTAGNPLGNVSITARPSRRFLWSLDSAAQQFLAEIPAATTVTPDSGAFVVWVDPYFAQVWGHYDLAFEPSTDSNAPDWLQPDIEIPRVQNQVVDQLDPIAIPDAAYVHGELTDPAGNPVANGELRIFQPITDLSLCSQVPDSPPNCPIPAQLVAHGASDDLGIVRLSLPKN
ncbi:MAG TPA: hypothetical protein VGF94_09640 [Kofleriaceae bacterium]|jgi:hypothetical protein